MNNRACESTERTQALTHTQTRRGFVKTAGIALAGAAAMGLAGCAPSATGSGDATAKAGDITWDEEFDVIVVGAGIAGNAAALTVATEGNGASCLLIEKGSTPSGNSPFCKGDAIWTKDVAAMSSYMKELSHGTTPDDVLEAYAQGLGEIYDWVIELGANKEEMSITEPTSDPEERNAEYHELENSYAFGYFAIGKNTDVEVKGPDHVQVFLQDAVAQHSDIVDYRTSTPLVDLVQDESGAIVGIVAGEKNPTYIRAKRGVILCLGGFEHSPEMMQNYLGQGAAVPAAGSLNTGDGHRICARIGADFWHMNNCAGFWMAGRDLENTTYTNPPIFKPAPKGFGITVGVNGRRFYMDWDGYNVREKYPYMSDMSVHVGSRHGHMQFGGEWPHLPMPSKAWFLFDAEGLAQGAIPPSTTKGEPDKEGYALAANTIEELAALMEVPVDELVTTVDQWNECCANGKDAYFHRPESTLVPVQTPPFYAQLCAPSFLNTDGGPVRAANGAILDYDGNAIPGLYSAGEFGSIWGHYYEGGGNVAECLVFGRISARSALGNTAA
ncbi:FAD-dependent oxidoreductase [Eggerthella sinensis]|uniref:FAD-dependent oxidoreductase n=1 Tax=Eggerthella sinensis TaxID=242230 RepID=UPI00266BEC84|nr:FAD-binding protein [Eggerthella sinensis]